MNARSQKPDTDVAARESASSDEQLLNMLGYNQQFDRKMSMWSNFALGFLYLSPLVGVVALFGLGLQEGGPPSIWWIVIVMGGQLLVALVFGEIVSQYPLAGGVYQWARRLWGGRYAWLAAWLYICGLIIGITTTALFSATFVASLFGFENTRTATLLTGLVVLAIALALNLTGTKTLAKISSIALGAELAGVIAVGLFLLLFQRVQPLSVVFDSMGTGGEGSYVGAFLAASLVGLFLFYGFEACGEVAEEVPNPGRRIPRAMWMTVVVGGVSALLSFLGYLLAAPDLPAIVAGEIDDPISAILESTIGGFWTKVFLVIALTSFLAGVMGQMAAASRLIFSFGRDDMMPGASWIARMHPRLHVPAAALFSVCVLPVALFGVVYVFPDSLPRIAAFQMLAGYTAFQMVVLAALRQRLRGWKPAGSWTLGKLGMAVNVAALAYGITGMVLLARPGSADLAFLDRWIALIGFLIVLAAGLLYLFIAHPERKSSAPEGDALDVAERIHALRERSTAGATQTVASGVSDDAQAEPRSHQ